MEHDPNPTAMIRTALLMGRIPEAECSPETLEIASLVQRTLSGDSPAFECIISRYERRVVSLAMKLLGTIEDAQDAAQEVFLRAYKYLHRLDLQKPIEPWLMRMTVNVCRNIGRKRQRRLNTFSESETLDSPATSKSCDPFAGIAEEQERKMLWKALSTLPEKEPVKPTTYVLWFGPFLLVAGGLFTLCRSLIVRKRIIAARVLARMNTRK